MTPTVILTSPILASITWSNPDSAIAHWFRAHLGTTFAAVLWGMSEPASGWVIGGAVVLAALCLARRRSWHRLVTLLLVVPCGALFAEILKLIIQRHRPFEAGPYGVWGGYSFPSGHTISATLFYGFLAVSFIPVLNRRHWRWLCGSLAAALVLAVGFSRVALGAHYLTDVLGAMVLGLTWLAACSVSVRRFRRRPSEAALPNPN